MRLKRAMTSEQRWARPDTLRRTGRTHRMLLDILRKMEEDAINVRRYLVLAATEREADTIRDRFIRMILGCGFEFYRKGENLVVKIAMLKVIEIRFASRASEKKVKRGRTFFREFVDHHAYAFL